MKGKTELQRIALVFSGDFPEGNTKNARLKIVANQLSLANWKPAFFSVYPYRFSKSLNHKQPKKWQNLSIKYFSIGRIYPSLFVLRIFQIVFSHIAILWWTMFSARKYKVIYYYNPRFTDALFSLWLNSVIGRKCVVDQTELFSSGVNKKWHRLEERIIAKRATVLFVISKKLLDYYSPMRKSHLFDFPILINTERFNQEVNEVPYMMGYIGSFAPKDGVCLLLEAVKKVKDRIPEIKLRLIGHSPEMDKLKRVVNDMKLEKHTEITGSVTYEDVSWLLLECDTLLMNRDESEFATFGYPIKLGEYFACVKPVLMSNGEGFAIEFEDKNEVYKYEVDDVDSLVEKIIYRYEHIGESDAVAKRGYQFALDHFDANKKGQFLTNILKDL
tara:strand:- start:1342 stop:2502 length:1161 start_codon:yes stop_codon:yes gene_type:complete